MCDSENTVAYEHVQLERGDKCSWPGVCLFMAHLLFQRFFC